MVWVKASICHWENVYRIPDSQLVKARVVKKPEAKKEKWIDNLLYIVYSVFSTNLLEFV